MTDLETLRRVLLVLEKLAGLEDSDETNKAWMTVYTLAHAYGGHCQNPHQDWQELLPHLEEKLKNC